MRRLPSVPSWLVDNRIGKYLVGLVDALNRELRQKPSLTDGALYVSTEQPLAIVGDDGVTYFLAVESGKPVIKDAAGNEVFGANVAETDVANLFTALNTFSTMPEVTAGPMFQTGSNANGTWVILFGVIQVCWVTRMELPFNTTSACTATWTLPRAFANNTYFTGPFAAANAPGTHPDAFAVDATPFTDQIAGWATGSHTTTDCVVAVQRQRGETNFASGDEMYANVIAIGTPS